MSDQKKQAVLEWIDSLNVNEPGKLYLSIKKHIDEHGYVEAKTVTVHAKVPEATCESCE